MLYETDRKGGMDVSDDKMIIQMKGLTKAYGEKKAVDKKDTRKKKKK